MWENDFCKNFSPVFISHVRRTFRESLFYYAEWQEVYRQLQYNSHEKELEE